jgi:8-oxo-dGTP diphosphatase
MQSDRFHLIGAVFIILEKDNKIFLTRRKNTGWEDGKYSLTGGHLDGNETATQAAVREAQEELGITIDPTDLQFVNVSHLITNSERIHFTFVAKKWKGEPRNNETEKADDAQWFSIDKLPENTMEVSRETINWYRNNNIYTEFGWDKK